MLRPPRQFARFARPPGAGHWTASVRIEQATSNLSDFTPDHSVGEFVSLNSESVMDPPITAIAQREAASMGNFSAGHFLGSILARDLSGTFSFNASSSAKAAEVAEAAADRPARKSAECS